MKQKQNEKLYHVRNTEGTYVSEKRNYEIIHFWNVDFFH